MDPGLERFAVTIVTAKHRMFLFVDGEVLPDDALIAVALSDPYYLGVLSSRVHITWAQSAGGTLEDRERYNKSRCFEFQAGIGAAPVQRELVVAPAAQPGRQSWPKELPEQFKAVRAALAAQGVPAKPEEVAAQFIRVRRDRVAEVLKTLVSLGQARQAGRGLYAA